MNGIYTIQEGTKTLLVVEGKDEELFLGEFVKFLALKDLQVMPVGGKTKMRRDLGAVVDLPGFTDVESIGILRDADADPKAAFQSVRDVLKNLRLPVPNQPLTPAGRNPRVSVMIAPGAEEPGMLESLCLEAGAENPAMPCVDEYFKCLPTQPLNLPKARLQVFLASVDPNKRLGELAQGGYWDWNHAAFAALKAFLQQIAS